MCACRATASRGHRGHSPTCSQHLCRSAYLYGPARRARMQASIVAWGCTTPRPSRSTNPPPDSAPVAVMVPCRGATAGASVLSTQLCHPR